MNSFLLSMLILAVVVTVYGHECGKPDFPGLDSRRSNRITGGTEAIKGSSPWIARVGYRVLDWDDFTMRCAGTIISSKWIISAAHCFFYYPNNGPVVPDTDPLGYVLRVGEHDTAKAEGQETDYAVKRIYLHKSFHDPFKEEFDMALVELVNEIQFNTYVSPVCLPPTGSDPVSGKACVAAGWGTTSQGLPGFVQPEKILRQVGVNIVDCDVCNSMQNLNGKAKDHMLCAGERGKAVCQEDNGGPLVCKNDAGSYVLEGVIARETGCGTIGNNPDIYMRTGFFTLWIAATMDGSEVYPDTTAKPRLSTPVPPTTTTVATTTTTPPTTTSGAESSFIGLAFLLANLCQRVVIYFN